MKDISNYLTEAEKHMREIDKVICNATLTKDDISKARTSAILARARLDDVVNWIRDREGY